MSEFQIGFLVTYIIIIIVIMIISLIAIYDGRTDISEKVWARWVIFSPVWPLLIFWYWIAKPWYRILQKAKISEVISTIRTKKEEKGSGQLSLPK